MNMKDIAKIANVSISTVSRVLNNERGVKPAIRKRVKKVIEETGYRPNQLARRLIKKETNIIGIMLPWIHSCYLQRVNAISAVCRSRNYGIIILASGADKEQEIKDFYHFYEKQVDGIIYSAHKITDDYKRMLEEMHKQIPIVMVDQEVKDLNIPCVIHDSYDGAQKAIMHLIENGHTKIAFIGGLDEYDVNAEDRLRGFRDMLAAHKILISEAYIGKGDFGLSTGYHEMIKILDCSPEKPTALFAANDEIAIGAINAIFEKGLHVPEDISVVGYDGINFAEYSNPPLTTIYQDQYEVGIQAANLLLEYIQKKTVNIKKIVMGQKLIVRNSTRRI